MNRANRLNSVFAASVLLVGATACACLGQVPQVDTAVPSDGAHLAPGLFATDRSEPTSVTTPADKPLYSANTAVAVEPDMFAGVEAAVVYPHLHSDLIGLVPLTGRNQLVQLQNARLETTVSPKLELGMFRSADSLGEMVLAYRFLTSNGRDALFDPLTGGVTLRRSRLNFQSFDLDFACDIHEFGPGTSLRCEAGARLQIVFFDTKSESAILSQQASNYFFGAGPHAELTLTKRLNDQLSLFSAVDLAVIYGYNTDQNFAVTTIDPVIGTLFGASAQEQSAFSPSCRVQVGVAWCPAWSPNCQLGCGYQFEQWVNLGRVGSSVGSLSTQGFFLNCEWGF
jgi:hypothetical protein